MKNVNRMLSTLSSQQRLVTQKPLPKGFSYPKSRLREKNQEVCRIAGLSLGIKYCENSFTSNKVGMVHAQ